MNSVMVVGAGRIGVTMAELLSSSGDYAVTLLDASVAALEGAGPMPNVVKLRLDIADVRALQRALHGQLAVLSAVPFHLTVPIAEAALAAGVHYLDLTEDVANSAHVRQLADVATSAFIPQCGLAPGFVSIVAADLCRRFDTLLRVCLRTGALPQYPSNALGYNLTWSTDGLINEYCEMGEAIVAGELRQVPALAGCETFALDGVGYEAFHTAGGLGTLGLSLLGRVDQLDYKTIRYPGHAALMHVLLHDLRLQEKERRPVLKDILEYALPGTQQDVVIVFVTVTGWREGRYLQETYAHKIYSRTAGSGVPRSAIQLTTASSICAVLDLLVAGRLPVRGFVRQEDIALADFLHNRFGQVFAKPAASA